MTHDEIVAQLVAENPDVDFPADILEWDGGTIAAFAAGQRAIRRTAAAHGIPYEEFRRQLSATDPPEWPDLGKVL